MIKTCFWYLFSYENSQEKQLKLIWLRFLTTSGFGCHFWFLHFNRFLTGSSSLNILIIHIFVFRRSKSISPRNLLEKMNEIWKNNYLGVNFVFFKSPFWPEVDNVDSWIFISFLVFCLFSHTPNLEKIEWKLWSWHCFLFFQSKLRLWRHELCK